MWARFARRGWHPRSCVHALPRSPAPSTCKNVRDQTEPQACHTRRYSPRAAREGSWFTAVVVAAPPGRGVVDCVQHRARELAFVAIDQQDLGGAAEHVLPDQHHPHREDQREQHHPHAQQRSLVNRHGPLQKMAVSISRLRDVTRKPTTGMPAAASPRRLVRNSKLDRSKGDKGLGDQLGPSRAPGELGGGLKLGRRWNSQTQPDLLKLFLQVPNSNTKPDKWGIYSGLVQIGGSRDSTTRNVGLRRNCSGDDAGCQRGRADRQA